MHPNLKGTLAAMATGAIIIGGYIAITFHASCFDICILDRFSVSILCAVLGGSVGLVIGIFLSVLASLGACKRAFHFAIAGAVATVNIVALASIAMQVSYSAFSVDRLGDIAFGAAVGLAFYFRAAYKPTKHITPEF